LKAHFLDEGFIDEDRRLVGPIQICGSSLVHEQLDIATFQKLISVAKWYDKTQNTLI
jgi:hypothetical protein